MNRKENGFHIWCTTATGQIRYRPDREAVAQELMGHMEDAYDAHIARGLTPEEAEQKTLDSMGSAAAIAPQLAAIHKPFWGYIECVTRYIAYLLCCIVLFGGLTILAIRGESMLGLFDFDDIFSHNSADTSLSTVLELSPEVSVRSDGRTLAARHLQIWQWNDIPNAHKILAMELNIQDSTPWCEGYRFTDYFWIEDSLGNRYHSMALRMHDTQMMTIYEGQQGLFSSSFLLQIHDFPAQEVEWINICYDRDGRDIVLHIELTGGDTP